GTGGTEHGRAANRLVDGRTSGSDDGAMGCDQAGAGRDRLGESSEPGPRLERRLLRRPRDGVSRVDDGRQYAPEFHARFVGRATAGFRPTIEYAGDDDG